MRRPGRVLPSMLARRAGPRRNSMSGLVLYGVSSQNPRPKVAARITVESDEM